MLIFIQISGLIITSILISVGILKLVTYSVDADEIYIKKHEKDYLYLCDLAVDNFIHQFGDKLTPTTLKTSANTIINLLSEEVIKALSADKGFQKRKNIVHCQVKNTIYYLLKEKGYCFLYIGLCMEGFKSSYIPKERI